MVEVCYYCCNGTLHVSSPRLCFVEEVQVVKRTVSFKLVGVVCYCVYGGLETGA